MSSILSNRRLLLSVIWTELFQYGPNVHQHSTCSIPFLYVYFIWKLRTVDKHKFSSFPTYAIRHSIHFKRVSNNILFWFSLDFSHENWEWNDFFIHETSKWENRRQFSEHSFQFVLPLDWVTYTIGQSKRFYFCSVLFFWFRSFFEHLLPIWIHLTRNPICSAFFSSLHSCRNWFRTKESTFSSNVFKPSQF